MPGIVRETEDTTLNNKAPVPWCLNSSRGKRRQRNKKISAVTKTIMKIKQGDCIEKGAGLHSLYLNTI